MTTEPTILVGDCIQHMREVIAPASVHCIVSSPPYWALRDYGIPGRDWLDGWHGVYGNEPDYRQYIVHTLELFEAMGRVLRPDGVIWWNIGDAYADGCKGLIPHRVAIHLQDNGWCIRQDDIWAKPNPMAESIAGWHWERCRVKPSAIPRMGDPRLTGHRRYMLRGGRGLAEWEPCPGCSKCEPNEGWVLRRAKWRHTTAHEYVFQITQGGMYFGDHVAAAEPAVYAQSGRTSKKRGEFAGKGSPMPGREPFRAIREKRNPRSVWSFSTESYKGAHFATFPTELPFRCIQASTSVAGCCPHCGSQWAPVIVKDRQATRPGVATKVQDQDGLVIGNRDPQRHVTATRILDWRPTCDCPDHQPIPSTVYEPFGGSGTTAQVAFHMGRNAIISEVNPDYVELQRQRIAQRPRCLLVREKATKPKRPRKPKRGQLSLWPK